METGLNLDKMLKDVSAELKEWKVLMEDLAGAFYNRFPATRKCGWTLHLDRCAELKACDMCPHSIYWVRYYYVTFSKKQREEMGKAGLEPPKSKVSWDNTPSGISRERLPGRLKVTMADKRIYREYEAVRAEIMCQHTEFSKLRKKLLARVRNEKNDLALNMEFFEDGVFRDYYMAVLPSKPIKAAVISKIYELRKG
ncbi:MAG: hypothetical protein LBM00_05500 [Deltaproteobacteria bacterium]|jgi:hypothetical protein|nr:hypothetical protein [Deltaproteobacteria bacterium]